MEFPDLGKHCSLPSCKQLDYLPVNCDACQGIFCTEHMAYTAHQCPKSHLKDKKVPVCPLCNQPISIGASESLDAKVNEHIENYCRSDLASAKRKTYTNSCSRKGCKQREVVPVLCNLCRKNYCLRHRHENDHDCQAKSGQRGAGHAASARYSPAKAAAQRVMQKSTASSSSRGNQNPSRSTVPTRQAGLSENEALARAIQASLNESSSSRPSNVGSRTTQNNGSQEDEDRILAEVLAQSERDEEERQRRLRQNQDQQSQSSCAMS